MTTWKTANAVVRRLEAAIPVSEQGCRFIVEAPLEGDVRITPCVRTYEGAQRLLAGWGLTVTHITNLGLDTAVR